MVCPRMTNDKKFMKKRLDNSEIIKFKDFIMQVMYFFANNLLAIVL